MFRITRSSLLVALALLASAGPTVAADDDFKLEPGFTRLDNGKDLDGWTGNLTGWSVVDGAIHLDVKKARSNIYSKVVPSKNCVIRMQFKATKGADSGVFIYGNQ